MSSQREYVRKVFLHAWKEAINKPPSKTNHLNKKKPDTIKTAMFHKTALIIIAFFAISSLLSLHPSPYDLFSNPITCSILYLCLYISPPSSHSLIASFLSFALTPLPYPFPHLHIYLPSPPFRLPQNLYALAIQSISNIFHPLSYLLPLPSQPRQKHLPLISIRTFLPSPPKSSSYLPSLPKQKRPCNVPSPSSSTSHDTTQSSNMSHRKNLSHHLSPKLPLSPS
jgi:hypothetical protein